MDYVEIEGLRVHPLAGSLWKLKAIPVSDITIDPLLPELTHVEIAWPRELTRTNEFAVIIAWALRNFYIPTEANPSRKELVGGMVSYLNCLLPPDSVEGKGLLTEALNYAGIKPIWRVATSENLSDFQTPEALHVLRMFRSDTQHLFVHDRRQQLGLLGLILLLIGRSVTKVGYQEWVNNRLKTFSEVLGISEGNFIWTDRTSPTQRVLATLSTFLSAIQPLRARIFQVCMRAATSQVSISTQILSTVVRLSRGAEMSHIQLINDFLLTKYPEILRIWHLRGDLKKFKHAMEYLSTIPEDERMYVKILRPRSDTAVLDRNNFVTLSAAAFAAAKFEPPSMKNYREGQESAVERDVARVVTTYLTTSSTLSISDTSSKRRSLRKKRTDSLKVDPW